MKSIKTFLATFFLFITTSSSAGPVEQVGWTALKPLIDAASLDYGHVETSSMYYVFTSGAVTLATGIAKDGGADVTDYEATYKANAKDFFYSEVNRYQNLTGNGTTVVKSGAGILRAISINNNTTGGTITLYDNTAGSGTKIMTLQIGSPSGGLLSSSGLPGPITLPALDIRFNTGLTIVTTGSSSNNITAFYR